MPCHETPGRHYRVLIAVTGGDAGTHEFDTYASDAVAAVTAVARSIGRLDPLGRIDRIHASPTHDAE